LPLNIRPGKWRKIDYVRQQEGTGAGGTAPRDLEYRRRTGTLEIVDIVALNAEIERIVARGDVPRRKIAAIIAEIGRNQVLTK